MKVPLVILSPALLVAALLLCGAGWHPRGWQPRWPLIGARRIRKPNPVAAHLHMLRNCLVVRYEYSRLAPKSGMPPPLIIAVQSSSFFWPIFQKLRHSVKYSNTTSRSPASIRSLARLILGPKLWSAADPEVPPAASREALASAIFLSRRSATRPMIMLPKKIPKPGDS